MNSHKVIASFGFEIILWRIVDLVCSVGVNLYFEFNVSIIFYLVNNDIYYLCETEKISNKS